MVTTATTTVHLETGAKHSILHSESYLRGREPFVVIDLGKSVQLIVSDTDALVDLAQTCNRALNDLRKAYEGSDR